MPLRNNLLKIAFGTLILLLSYTQEAKAGLLITEIQVYGEKTDNDFVKIYNNSETALDISGYKIRKKSSTGKESSLVKFPKGSIIQTKGYFIWANSKNNFNSNIGANAWTTATLSKNNSISLLDPNGTILDALAWGEGKNPFVKGLPFPENPSKNQRLKRKLINGNYQDTSNNRDDFYLDPPLFAKEDNSQSKTEPENYLILREQKNTNTSSEDKKTYKEDVVHQPISYENKNLYLTTTLQHIQLEKQGKLIDINTASLSDLQTLAGIGPTLAQRIIDYRIFYSVDELTKVPGIGPKTLEEIKKQGIAWVDPGLEKQKNAAGNTNSQSPKPGINTAQLKPITQQHISISTKKSLLVFFMATITTIICAIVILSLKINYKNNRIKTSASS